MQHRSLLNRIYSFKSTSYKMAQRLHKNKKMHERGSLWPAHNYNFTPMKAVSIVVYTRRPINLSQARPKYPDDLLQQALTLAQRAHALQPTHLLTLKLAGAH